MHRKLIYFCLFLVGIIFFIPVVFSYAETAQTTQNITDIQNQINQKNSDLASLEQEITTYQTQLDSLDKQKDSLSISLQELSLTKKSLDTNIAITQNKIDKTNLAIKSLSSNINDKENSITTETQAIVNDIRNTDEMERANLLETILSQDNFTSMWNDIDNISTIRENLSKNIVSLQQTKGALENTRTATMAAKAQLTNLKSQLADQQKIVVQNTNDKNKLLKQTNDSETSYQKLLRERTAERDAFEKEINDYEAQLHFIIDPSKLPPGGVLSWPLEKIFVTQLFGKTVDSKRLYVSGTHNGVDFRAAVGTPVMSMADGTVLGIGDTDVTCPGASYGKFVFIQYDNGLSSTFGHLSLIKAYNGEQVKRGDVVGYSGATGYVTGPHLHVSLYASQAVKMATKPSAACLGHTYTLPIAPVDAYLDALVYLPPYKVNSSILNNNSTE